MTLETEARLIQSIPKNYAGLFSLMQEAISVISNGGDVVFGIIRELH